MGVGYGGVPWSGTKLSYAGKLMAYAGLGNSSADLRPLVRSVFEIAGTFDHIIGYLPSELIRVACDGPAQQKALAASIQAEFQEIVKRTIGSLLELVGPNNVEGVVLSGGCALNVLTNQLIHHSLLSNAFYSENQSAFLSTRP